MNPVMAEDRMRGTLVQINISGGGMPKLPIPEARITYDGVEGDWQLDRKHHGGPLRAVYLLSVEVYEELRQAGVLVGPGDLGENLTTQGLDLRLLAPGARLRVGGCVLELTMARELCESLKRWHEDLPRLLAGRSGWLAKVLREGLVRTGDPIELLPDEDED